MLTYRTAWGSIRTAASGSPMQLARIARATSDAWGQRAEPLADSDSAPSAPCQRPVGRDVEELTPVTQADSELERLLAKSPDSALHLFGDCSHGGPRLGVRPQLALIFLGPGPPFHPAPGSFYSLFLPFGHLRISPVGLESGSLWHYGSYFVHC